MSKTPNTVWQGSLWLAIICLVAGAATTAFAVPPGQVLRSTDIMRFEVACCISFGESIQVVEAAKPVPVVVTWGVDYDDRGQSQIGLMLNGGPCAFYGSGSIAGTLGESFRTFQWIIFPSDGLQAGTNTFTLCGGGGFGEIPRLVIISNTLAARLSN